MLTRSAARKRSNTAAILEREMLEQCDPMKHLNDDTINMSFSHFTLEELVSLERVSREWQAALRSFRVSGRMLSGRAFLMKAMWLSNVLVCR
jgi:hypothetical protein